MHLNNLTQKLGFKIN